ncbi:MAG: phosphotransferase family protein [Flavobacteriaceae bacterium]|nr:phosphotransferase family protein [Flavobacteriaceae bacterium]
MNEALDKAQKVHDGEALDIKKLNTYFEGHLSPFEKITAVKQFPGGYSNLTYLLKTATKEYVLRRPPRGAKIKSAHDMHREFEVLSQLQPVYTKIPQPVCYCDDATIIGASFYIMERIKGVILRNQIPKGLTLTTAHFKQLSTECIDTLLALHQLDINKTGLVNLGNPEGYVSRQVSGWTKRYFNAETDSIKGMNKAAEWLQSHLPQTQTTAFIHNDFKYDNFILDLNNLHIKAVLDWEMATVGDPLMDLGTTLAYWVESEDNKALRAFNLTWVDGNLRREEVVTYYASQSPLDLKDIVFYYVFGSFKLGVIAQQIYARYKKGFSKDPRFAGLIYVVNACADNAQQAIKFNRIHDFR